MSDRRNVFRINEFARRVGRSVQTVRRWEKDGKLEPKRWPSGHRYFDEADVKAMLGIGPEKRETVVYCRVSGYDQLNNLDSQVQAAEEYCRDTGIFVDQWIKEVGGGMNFKRKHFLNLLDRIQRGEIQKLVVVHKDRLMRFGFELFSHIAQESGCEIVVMNQETQSSHQEMAEDLMGIAHTFSGRIFSMRKYRDQIKNDHPHLKLAIPKEALH